MATLSSPDAQTLLTDIRVMLRQPDPNNSVWSDEELLGYINEAVRRYFAEVVQHSNGEFNTSTTLDLTANSETVDLPTDFFHVRAVYRKVTQGYEILSYKNNLTDGFTTGVSGGAAYLPYYYLRDNKLVLRPTPGFSESAALLLEYVYFPPTMVSGGDVLTTSVSPVFRDLLVMYAVYKAKVSESLVSGVNTSALAKDNLNDLYVAFKDVMAKRAIGPTFVQSYHPEEY